LTHARSSTIPARPRNKIEITSIPLPNQIVGNHGQLGVCLLEADSLTEPSVNQQVAVLPTVQVVCRSTFQRRLRHGQICRCLYDSIGKAVESLGSHSHHCEGAAVDGHLAAHHVCIAVESLLPEVVAEYKHRVAVGNLAFAAQQEPSSRWFDSKRGKEIAAHISGYDSFRLLPGGGKSVQACPHRKDLAERVPALGADRLELRRGERTLQRSVVLGVSQRRNLLRILHRKRLEQKGVHQAEDGRIGADAQSQCEHGGNRKARRFSKLTKGEADILQQDAHGALPDLTLNGPNRASSRPNRFPAQTADFD
jgi:hypothetical protein